ncbi:DUF4350 domain-containing protein [Streptomyces sp. NPDC048057]|uniref:DUF4350 domain-containing protein n=1 Tax=Streptomyces sp. NPDC048057 TaxID=3155628 RepID=UPI0033D51234
MTRAAPSTTSLAPTGHQIWTRTRGLLLGLAVLITAGIVIAAMRSGDRHGSLDPRSADRSGSRAVAELLEDRGVTVRVATTLREATTSVGPDTTLLVAAPDLLTDSQQQALRKAANDSGGRTVLVAPGPTSLSALAPGIRSVATTDVTSLDAECSLPAARNAGDVELGGEQYAVADGPGTDSCYPVDGLPTLVRTDTGEGDTVLLGAPDLLKNERLDKNGNASLALQLLGSRNHLVWYLPSLSDGSTAPDGGDESFLDLLPSGWLWASFQLFVAAALAAIWRAHRLGPLVTERLPVVIHASETTEGRARLYHQAKARDRAADVLRTATRERLAPLLGVAPAHAHSSDALLPAVAARIGPGDQGPATLLFGPPPTDDAALVRLADQLDALEREVRSS